MDVFGKRINYYLILKNATFLITRRNETRYNKQNSRYNREQRPR